MTLALCIILLVVAVAICVLVMMQSDKDTKLSGTIAGGSDTFYGKDKSAHSERSLFKWTIIFSVIFAVCVLAVYIIQPDYAQSFALDDWASSDLCNYADAIKNAK